MFRIPGEVYQGESHTETIWEGPGWYCTTRTWPGSDLYRQWKVSSDPDSNLKYADTRNSCERSYGGPIRWLSSEDD